jgi:hypothetical protein
VSKTSKTISDSRQAREAPVKMIRAVRESYYNDAGSDQWPVTKSTCVLDGGSEFGQAFLSGHGGRGAQRCVENLARCSPVRKCSYTNFSNMYSVVYGVSHAYKESAHCRLEAQYAFQRKKDIWRL